MVGDPLTRVWVLSVDLGVGGTDITSGSRARPTYSCDRWVCDLGVLDVSSIFGWVRGTGAFTVVFSDFCFCFKNTTRAAVPWQWPLPQCSVFFTTWDNCRWIPGHRELKNEVSEISSLLWIDKARVKDKTYKLVDGSQFWFRVPFHLNFIKSSFNLNFDYQTLINFKWILNELWMVISFKKWISFFKWNGQSSTFGGKVHSCCVFYCHLKTYCGPSSETMQFPELIFPITYIPVFFKKKQDLSPSNIEKHNMEGGKVNRSR